jgi:hypothetical protein
MSLVHVEVVIAAPPLRVWRALCDPTEVVQWDSTVEAALDAPPDYPQPGQHVRWRCRAGLFRILHDRPQNVIEQRKLRSRLDLGLIRYDETYTLGPADGGTRLELNLDVRLAIPFVGGLLARLRAREDALRAFEASLAALATHCEDPAAGLSCGGS